MFKTWLVFLSGLFLLAGHCLASDAGSIVNDLPGAYTGTYQWENSDDIYDVSITFSGVKKIDNGAVEITGRENFVNRNDRNKIFDSNIRAVIHPQTLTIEIEEIYDKKDDFTPMVYKGTLSSDLTKMNVYWISPEGKKVSMALRAK
ncbi:MAG TPA: hypothetical protein VI298_10995 [Geobacteraceae bacterium]